MVCQQTPSGSDQSTCGWAGRGTPANQLRNSLSMELLDGSSECIFALDRSWRFTFLNSAAVKEIAGGRELVGRNFWEEFPEATDVAAYYRRAMQKQVNATFEVFYEPLSAWYKVQIRPLASGGLGIWFKQTTEQREREAHLSTLFNQSLVGMALYGRDRRLQMANAKFCEILGRSAGELKALSVSDYTHTEDISWNLPLLESHRQIGEPFQIEKRYLRPDGSTALCKVSVSFVLNVKGGVDSTIVVAEEITEHRKAEQSFQEGEKLNRSVLDASADCIKILSIGGKIEVMNNPGIDALEIANFEEMRGTAWVKLWPEESQTIVDAAIDQARTGKNARFTAFCPTMAGTPKWWDVVVSPICDDERKVTRILVISRDVTVHRTSAARLKWTSEHDGLTELPNRRGFEKHLQAAIIRGMQRDQKVGLLLLDLDHFKHVNDTLGHAAGDHLLKVFAKRLRESVREGDFIARLGGDEFSIIIESKGRELNMVEVGNSILERLQEPIRFDGRVLTAGASVGGAVFPTDASSANELLKNADIALYALKESGRGGTRLFQNHMRQEAKRVSSQLNLARHAITQQSVEPHYQQKIDLTTGEITGFEALLRWRHLTRGLQLPQTVSEAFKDYELASRIGDLMQRRVFKDMRDWLDRDAQFGFVAINAAPVEFLRDDFAERLMARMQEHEIPPYLLEVEVTEHVFIERGSDFVGRALKTLSRAGVKIALDDFGTGYSSLSHLRDYPVDVVKIDRSFIDRVDSDPEVCAIVRAVIELAKSLNLEVVAEGVETARQLERLAELGCRMGQGFYFGRAIEAQEVPNLLKNSTGWQNDPKSRNMPRLLRSA